MLDRRSQSPAQLRTKDETPRTRSIIVMFVISGCVAARCNPFLQFLISSSYFLMSALRSAIQISSRVPVSEIRYPKSRVRLLTANGRAIRRDILSATSARQRPRLWQRLGQPTIFATKISLHFFHAPRPVLARLPRSLFPSPRSHSLAGPHSPPGPIVFAL